METTKIMRSTNKFDFIQVPGLANKFQKKQRKVILKNYQSPGDILMLTAAVRDLKLSHPNILIDVKTSVGAIWENNSYIVSLDQDDEDVEIYKVDYDIVHSSNEGQYHFIHGFRKDLEKKLELTIKSTLFKGDIHISDEEKSWTSQVEDMGVKEDFWIMMAGGKYDFTCISEGNRIQTKKGYKKIETVSNTDQILTEWGFKKCDGSVYKGEKECLNLKTRLSSIDVTLDHKFKTMDINGQIKWTKAREIKKGDYILGRRGDSKILNIKEDDKDKWFALGRLWGDGYIHKNACYWIFSENDKDAKKRVEQWLNKKGLKFSLKERLPDFANNIKRNKIDYRVSVHNPFNSDELPEFKPKGMWRSNGFPDKYFALNYVDLKSFIEGLFSSDGTISNGHNKKDKGHITYTTIHKKFGIDIRKILWQVGVTSTIKKFEFISIWNKKCSGVNISIIGTKSRKNFTEIGFYEKYKNDKMIELNNSNSFSPNDKFHGIPFIRSFINKIKTKKDLDINKKKKSYRIKNDLKKSNIIRDSIIENIYKLFENIDLHSVLNNYVNNDWYFDQVEEITKVGKKRVYDIINSETESYVVEGFVSHNCKWWNPVYYQEVVDYFKGKITFVRCGEEGHWHPELKGVINLIGKTDFRQFIRLIYHSVGVVCPVTFAMHAAAAIEVKKGLKNRPCVVIAGGREPSQWEKYPHHRFLETNGSINCCDHGGCWKSRCQKVGDGDDKDEKDLCLYPVKVNKDLLIPKCMDMIKPTDVIKAIEMYYNGGVLQYNDNK